MDWTLRHTVPTLRFGIFSFRKKGITAIYRFRLAVLWLLGSIQMSFSSSVPEISQL
jgi:hypothetical protein